MRRISLCALLLHYHVHHVVSAPPPNFKDTLDFLDGLVGREEDSGKVDVSVDGPTLPSYIDPTVVHISNLPGKWSKLRIALLFGEFDMKLIQMDKVPGSARVWFFNEKDAQAARDKFNGVTGPDGHTISIVLASAVDTPSRTLYVANLDPSWRTEDLARHFAQYGEVDVADVPVDSEPSNRGYGFVQFVSEEAMGNALSDPKRDGRFLLAPYESRNSHSVHSRWNRCVLIPLLPPAASPLFASILLGLVQIGPTDSILLQSYPPGTDKYLSQWGTVCYSSRALAERAIEYMRIVKVRDGQFLSAEPRQWEMDQAPLLPSMATKPGAFVDPNRPAPIASPADLVPPPAWTGIAPLLAPMVRPPPPYMHPTSPVAPPPPPYKPRPTSPVAARVAPPPPYQHQGYHRIPVVVPPPRSYLSTGPPSKLSPLAKQWVAPHDKS